WSASLYATANQFANRIGSFPSLAVHRNRQNQFRLTGSVRIDRPEHWIPLRSDVKSSSRGIAALQRHQGTGRPILSYKCWEELLCVFAPASLNLLRRHYADQHQHVVQFIRVCCRGPRFRLDLFDRGRVEDPQSVATVSFRSTPGVNGLSPPFFKRRVVEKCVRARIQDFGCERRRLRQIACDTVNLAVLDLAQNFL